MSLDQAQKPGPTKPCLFGAEECVQRTPGKGTSLVGHNHRSAMSICAALAEGNAVICSTAFRPAISLQQSDELCACDCRELARHEASSELQTLYGS